MRIGIDIDGVLQNISEFILDYGSKYCYDNGIKFEIHSNEYDESKALGISNNEAEKFWNKYLVEYVTNYKPRKFAKEVIDLLKEKNEIYIITSRNEYGLPREEYGHMQELTKRWFEKNKIYYDKLIFSPENKVDICLNNNIEMMIEDWDKNIKELSNAGINVVCFDNPYNKNNVNENIPRVFSWYDLLNKLEKQTKTKRE